MMRWRRCISYNHISIEFMDKMVFIHYILPFVGALAMAVILTILIKRFAEIRQIVDVPTSERKIHTKPIPLLGGLAVFIAVLILMIVFRDNLLDGRIQPFFLLAIGLGGLLLMIGGYLDDRFKLKPYLTIIWPILAALLVVFSGMEIKFITNPLGGVINITSGILSSLLTFFWLMGMMYTTKLLDGLDGLVAGVTVIASVILFCVSLFWDISQSGTSILALILAGAALGFLIFNFYPAKIFLGEGGSTFLGFLLGVLAIISGAKIAAALLIMGIPILDVGWVIIRRLFKEKHSVFLADKKHLHHQLLTAGLNQRQVVFLLYFLTLLFGSVAIFQQTIGKLIAFSVLILVMIILAIFVSKKKKAI